ncbi:TPA: hypothetical protein JAN90_16075 [Legionella pneumophila]|uniref:hypothetical protein n=1 Tax=Legionella pneumophila TaxID=446 RepID=UPI00077859AC|nr:hypothetical protein [Legionella pneumophila]HAT8869528.1 hypothetical protein [Legionella pneumophila subsp. pneumophila]HAT7074239.1 hypothetical protein [Legionella pneumophila]HAT8623268.1 hypothetical protein [Legionella pneumophila]HAT8643114.1 hypothetical protein [Legionella pneumophila]HAT8891242.1 hypothetical protein [Legionella pneumophila subsp. pneumophila]
MNHNSLQIGSILYVSWGYDQTNIDFYEVTKLIGSITLELRELRQEPIPNGFGLSGKTKPIPGNYISPPFRKRINMHGSVKINEVVWASIWSGEALYYSSYA